MSLLLLDIGNTNTHAGFSKPGGLIAQTNVETACWETGKAPAGIHKWLGNKEPQALAICSVVPNVTSKVQAWAKKNGLPVFTLTHQTVALIGINYPKPETIGPDRLANAIAARQFYGAPSVVVDFGTAVTFDIIDKKGDYVGGIIAPGLSALTDYLHEKTALLPKIEIRSIKKCIGKSTEEAMLIGAVHGYRGLIRELAREVRQELGTRNLPVIATGGYAALIAKNVPEISAVRPNLTLEGLRLAWEHSTSA